MNNIIDQATILEAFISGKVPKPTPATTDELVLYDGSGTLKSTPYGTKVSSVGLAMPTNEFTVTNSPVTAADTLTVAWKTQTLQKFFAAPVGSTGVPSFRDMTAPDLTIPPYSVPALLIDWSQGCVFVKVLTVSTGYTMGSQSDGQTITVFMIQDGTGGRTVAWPVGIKWPGGAPPVQSPTAGHTDIYKFWSISGTMFGTRIATDLS